MLKNSFWKLCLFLFLHSALPSLSTKDTVHRSTYTWAHHQVLLVSAGKWIWIHTNLNNPFYWFSCSIPSLLTCKHLPLIHRCSVLGPDLSCTCFGLAHKLDTGCSRLWVRPGKIATINYYKRRQRQAGSKRAVRRGWQVPFWALFWSPRGVRDTSTQEGRAEQVTESIKKTSHMTVFQNEIWAKKSQ